MRGRLVRIFSDDAGFLRGVDRCEQLLAKLLALLLLVVILVASLQLVVQVSVQMVTPGTLWQGDRFNHVLGELLNMLIALEVLQNITSYLRRHVVQVELVLITAMTAVARKVIVMPSGGEAKPLLLATLGVAVMGLAGAYWLVRTLNLRQPLSRKGPAIWNPYHDRSQQDDGGGVP